MPDFEDITITLSEGYNAYARYWPVNSPRGAVLYHHGIQSHTGWFERSARCMAEAGFAVLQFDRRGSGRNQEMRGHAASAQQLIADTHAAHAALTRRSGIDQHHAAGVSWGGRMAVTAYVDNPSSVRSLILITPGLYPLVGVSKQEAARIGFAMLYELESRFDIPLNTPELLTSSEHAQHCIREDPYILNQATAGFFLASRRMDKMITRLPKQPPVPVFLALSADEGIIDNEKTGQFHDDLPWPQKSLHTYERSRHTLEYEPDAAQFLVDLRAFLDGVAG